jgi:carboxyl-terminal processing protease
MILQRTAKTISIILLNFEILICMRKIFIKACLFVVTTIGIVAFITQEVFGQEKNGSKVEVAELPAYIPPFCIGKTITKMSRSEMLAQTVSDVKPNPPITPANQLKLFNELANIITEVYLYPDFRGINWPGIEARFRNRVEQGLDTEEFYIEMEQFISSLDDKHSTFESPAKAVAVKAQLAGQNSYVGVGALFQPMVESKHVSILAVFPGSPAEHSGLQQHDVVLEVDGLPLIENEKVYPLTRGPECSMATLTVKSPGKEPRKVKIIRSQVTGPMPVYARLIPSADGRRIGYIFLPTFLDLTIPDQVKKALEDFGPLDGLVLDDRMNSGGSGKVLIPLLGYFTAGTLGHFVSRTNSRPLEILAAPIHNSQKVPMIILVSKNTVSYGEVFAGALQDIGRAKIVGQNTAGHVETLRGHDFADGSKAWIAEERFDPINSHTNWQGQGVRPDVEVLAEWDEFTFENDPTLVAALKLLPRQ